jgi:hypothetical protein
MTTTSEQLATRPAQDHQRAARVKIKRGYTPLHHDPEEINFSVAGAPSALIVGAAAAAPSQAAGGLVVAGGVSC